VDSDNKTLQIAYLSSVDTLKSEVFDGLDQFVSGYVDWIEKQKLLAASVSSDEQEAAKRIIKRMDIAASRMKQGVLFLRKDKLAKQSFALANQAMLDQMMQYDRSQGKIKTPDQYRWRPFQLAFVLSSIESVVNEESNFRDTVDLIWFPTGGGKTEAYLGLIAFLIVWRRLANRESGGGTTVIMRYTLRLLTAQQYLRATRMICALELIRRKRPELGKEPITIGMWVGAATSPNTLVLHKRLSIKPPVETEQHLWSWWYAIVLGVENPSLPLKIMLFLPWNFISVAPIGIAILGCLPGGSFPAMWLMKNFMLIRRLCLSLR